VFVVNNTLYKVFVLKPVS